MSVSSLLALMTLALATLALSHDFGTHAGNSSNNIGAQKVVSQG